LPEQVLYCIFSNIPRSCSAYRKENFSIARKVSGTTIVSAVLIVVIIVIAGSATFLGLTIAIGTDSKTQSSSNSSLVSGTQSDQSPSSSPNFSFSTYLTTTSSASSNEDTDISICCGYIITTVTTTSITWPAPSLSSIELENTQVGQYPNQIALNPRTGLIYVSDLFSSNLTVVNSRTRTVVTTINLSGTPAFGISVDPATNMIYVPSNAGIIEIDGETNNITGVMGFNVNSLDINPNTDTLWGISSGNLYAINATTGALLDNISVGAQLLSLAVNQNLNMVYVAACGNMTLACGGAEVLAFNGTTYNGVLTIVELALGYSLDYLGFNFPIVVDPSTNTVYAFRESSSNLELVAMRFDEDSWTTLYSSAIGSSCSGAGGGTFAFDSATNQLVVTFTSQQFFLFINAGTGQLVNMLSTSGNIFDTAFNPSNNQVYITANSSLIFLLDRTQQNFVNSSALQTGICLP
jgi:YVTN family beta-propeller protein